MKHKYTFPALLLTLALTLAVFPASAAENNIPSIIVNDDEWYRDSTTPLTVRDGKYCVPAEVFTMFDYIRVTQPKEGNLLIINTTNGAYISILYMEQKAAVNGKIYDNIGVFRRSEKYYVDAYLTAEALGISCETRTGTSDSAESTPESAPPPEIPEGTTILRLYDGNRVFTLDELIASYVTGMYDDSDAAETDRNPADEPPYDDYDDYEDDDYDYDVPRRIYVLCSTPRDSTDLFAAMPALEDEGLDYTAALDEASAADSDYVMSKLIMGEILLMPEGYAEKRNTAGLLYMTDGEEIKAYAASLADKMDEINEAQKKKSGRNARFTLTSNNPEIDKILAERGYFPVTPDYEINGASYPEGVVSDIERKLADGGDVTVYLSDCWSSLHMAELLYDMSARGYEILNLAGD